ncbi:MAG: hypothetical protein IKX35_07835 [Bacteroidales bacterium]|nr:hypothetical protein [Bacteroidales bacterium]
MKRLQIIAILLLIVLAACNSKKQVPEPVEGPSKELSAIDSLMWRQPDSALTVLMDYFDDDSRDAARHVSTTGTFENHYANLLLAELLFKNYAFQTNRTQLLEAVSYFDSLVRPASPFKGAEGIKKDLTPNPVFLDARAHYINGVGYYEHDSVVEACKEYLKALEVMEDRFEEKELVGEKAQFMAYAYTRLTGLSSDLYLHEQAIYFAHSSMIYYEKSDVPALYTARILNEIGSQYDMMKRLDSATCYYQKAMDALDDTTTLMYRDIAMHVICLEYKTGVCQADIAIKKLRQLLLNSESDRETHVRYQNIGEIFYHEQSYDSAWYYLSTVFQTTYMVGLKRQAAEWLVEICKVQGREDNILEYADFLVPFANQEENQSAIKSELTELYKAFGQTKLKLEHQKEKREQFRFAICVFLGLLVVLLIVVLLYQTNKRSKRHLENLIETERNEHKIQQAALSGRLKRSNAALREKEKMGYFDRPSKQIHYDQTENYSDEPICQRILSSCNDENNAIKTSIPVSSYADIALTDAQKAELKNAALAHYASLFKMLKQQHPELKEKDFLYCYLSLLGLDNAQIAVMTQLSYRTVWEREKRLQHIFQKEERISIILNEMMTD